MPAAKSKYRYPRGRQQTRPVVVHPLYPLAVLIARLGFFLGFLMTALLFFWGAVEILTLLLK